MRPVALAFVAAALLAAAPAAHAADYTVTGGKLDWTIANFFVSGDPDRTWLGYASNTTGGGAPNGNITATAPATIKDRSGTVVPIVDGTTPRGLDRLYTLSYPGAAGT